MNPFCKKYIIWNPFCKNKIIWNKWMKTFIQSFWLNCLNEWFRHQMHLNSHWSPPTDITWLRFLCLQHKKVVYAVADCLWSCEANISLHDERCSLISSCTEAGLFWFNCDFKGFIDLVESSFTGSHITLQPKTGCPLKLSRVELVSTWMGDLLGKLGCCWKRC